MGNNELVPGFDDQVCKYLEIRLEKSDRENASISLALG
jgi:hypothetical protein